MKFEAKEEARGVLLEVGVRVAPEFPGWEGGYPEKVPGRPFVRVMYTARSQHWNNSGQTVINLWDYSIAA